MIFLKSKVLCSPCKLASIKEVYYEARWTLEINPRLSNLQLVSNKLRNAFYPDVLQMNAELRLFSFGGAIVVDTDNHK